MKCNSIGFQQIKHHMHELKIGEWYCIFQYVGVTHNHYVSIIYTYMWGVHVCVCVYIYN